MAQGVFGYTSYDAVQAFETINFSSKKDDSVAIPIMRYRLYQYVIVINHFKDEMYVCENHFDGIDSKLNDLLSLVKSRDIPSYPFHKKGELNSNISDEDYKAIVDKGIAACYRGDVFQIVLSRRFQQKFIGDEFNVYRSLRSINPSPYLFYFDYGDYKIAGSSPEAQVIVKNNRVVMHPIAGTVKRTGNEENDEALAKKLQADAKENAEHVMLVDLARNDLSRIGKKVSVSKNKEVQYFSHVIHLVSEVEATVSNNENPFLIIAKTFPAGTLSGAPKYKAMQLIDEYENIDRGFYGGIIGFVGFDGSVNHAIMIRTFLSKNNTITIQAGAGVVAASTADGELQEVNNKLRALISAIDMATTLTV